MTVSAARSLPAWSAIRLRSRFENCPMAVILSRSLSQHCGVCNSQSPAESSRRLPLVRSQTWCSSPGDTCRTAFSIRSRYGVGDTAAAATPCSAAGAIDEETAAMNAVTATVLMVILMFASQASRKRSQVTGHAERG
jgi:hypothetical protein